MLVPMMLAAFVGSTVQAAAGFGFALLAAPVFLGTMNSLAAMQVLVIIHLWQSLVAVPGLAARAPRDLLFPLMAGAAIGFPLGLWIFQALDIAAMKLTVGLTVIAFTLLLIARELGLLEALTRLGQARLARHPLPLGVTGIAAGFLTPVLVMPGPPVILHLSALQVGKDDSRALALTFFGFCYLAVTLLHWLTGTVTASVWLHAAALAPVVIAGTVTGSFIARRVSETRFRWGVLMLLLVSGAVAIATSG